MKECCFKISLPLEEAINRYCEWIDEELGFVLNEYGEYVDKSIHVSSSDDRWTYFVDLEGEAFFGLSSESWLTLSKNQSVTYAYYDEDLNAELIVIENGRLIREFSLYEDEPDANVNVGKFDFEKKSPIKDWNDVATFLEMEL
ncbi:hypothetical protein CHH83_10165 [Bacillus sp. 7586-K]|nr:hypothetical protein CHH83_10165 [Bacillus sp. 7586-K]